MNLDPFKRQVLALFFIVSAVPALVVGAVWYIYTQSSDLNFLFLDFRSFVLPVILVGIIPAVILSYVFAELLSRPVRRIRQAAQELAQGNFKTQFRHRSATEFNEIGQALDQIAIRLQQTISQAASEQAIIESERNKLRGVLNAMTDGVFALDRSGRIILFNKAASELTGRSIEAVAGQLSEKVMPFRQDGELVMTRFLASRTGNENKVGEWKGLELYRADGASLIVDVQAKIQTDDPNGIAALITFHDLTKSHQLEQMKVDFVALAAHELRTPLTEIKGYLDILRHEAKGLTKANRDFLDRSMQSANQLGGLMHNLLNVSRIEHGELGYKPERIDYAAFLQDLYREMNDRAKQQKRTLKLDIPAHLPHLMADSLGMREVLINLIDNAINHTAPGLGIITVSVRHHPHEMETSITDNGVGIPADSLPRLFNKFYRVNELKSTTRGTGLGLFICKSIVEEHGGHIWVESVEGEGSTFSFRLPLHPPAVARATTPGDNNADKPETHTITRGAHGWIKNHPVRRR
jgi:two-component system phosphate regulon sensor histidine kinase PhoR